MEHAEMINKMVDDIIQGNNTNAQDTFNTLIASKVTSAMDSRKVELAQQIYSRSQEQNDEQTAD